jgi:hypothetical protein
MALSDVFAKQKSTGGGLSSVFSKQSSSVSGGLGSVFAPKKVDTNTSNGLYQLAVGSGLQKQADQILSQKGEETNKIFSGGFMSDIFDALNALQYGVVGMLKGKGFVEGVKTRQSWSDDDALGEYGIPGMIGGIALDIACDPLTYIAPWTIAKKIPGVSKGVSSIISKVFRKKVIQKTIQPGVDALGKVMSKEVVEGGTATGKWLARNLSWAYGKDPVYLETLMRSKKNVVRANENILNLSRNIVKIKDPQKLSSLLVKDDTGRWVRNSLDEIKKVLSPEEFVNVETAFNKLDDLSEKLVKFGVLDKGTFEQTAGKYIKNAYTEYELSKKVGFFGKLGIKGTKTRKSIEEFAQGYLNKMTPEEVAKIAPNAIGENGKISLKLLTDDDIYEIGSEAMMKLGQIDNPAYLLSKSMLDMTKDLENAKLFTQISQRFGSNVFKEGFERLPDTKRLGEMAGKFVPKNIFDDIQEITKPVSSDAVKKVVAGFKFGKVVMNPATHARNVISNQILNFWKLGMNPLDPRTIKAQATAIKQMAKGGNFIDEAMKVGYNLDTYAYNEIKAILNSSDGLKAFGKLKSSANNIINKMSDIYQREENFAKLSAFIFNRQVKKMGIDDAWKMAEAATFNYAQVTPFIRRLRESLFGFPFITFTYKATPLALETALKHPGRISVIGKIKSAIEAQSDIKETDRERASEPAWIRDGFYIKLPIKNKDGSSAYFDLSYIIPFGDLTSGQMFTRGVERETGLKESAVETAMQKSPVLNFIKEISQNKNFYGDKIWKESDPVEKQLGDLFLHLTKTYSPPLVGDQLPGGYMEGSDYQERRQKGIPGAIQKDQLMNELLRNVGLKTQSIDADIQESYMEWEKKKALTTLLKEAGILKDYTTTYIPK